MRNTSHIAEVCRTQIIAALTQNDLDTLVTVADRHRDTARATIKGFLLPTLRPFGEESRLVVSRPARVAL